MKILKEIFGRIWALWGLLLFVATMFIALIFFLPCAILPEPKKAFWHKSVSKIWMTVYLNLIGCPLKIYNKEVFKKGENYIVICNHNSLIDIPVTTPFLPNPNKTIAKNSFAKVPFFGWIYAWGSILVDRKSLKSKSESFDSMVKVLMDWHIDMVIYPEGTRNKSDKPLGKFYDGAFKLAEKTGKNILPSVLLNARKVLPASKPFFLMPHKLEIHFLPVIIAQGKDFRQLKEESYQTMYTFLEKQKS